jgi:hypothetical protein
MKRIVLAVALLLAVAVPVDAATFTITVNRFTSRVARNTNAVITITTQKAARCTISVIYSNGPSTAAGLSAKTVPSTGVNAGKLTWTWKIGGSTKKGTWPVRIRCTYGRNTGAVNRNLTVI